jgi:hypothetical protein
MSISVNQSLTARLSLLGLQGSASISALVGAQSGGTSALRSLVGLIGTSNPASISALVGKSSATHCSAFYPRTQICRTVGHQARPGQIYGGRSQNGQIYLGRISGQEYVGSFGKPVDLRGGKVLYRGKLYNSRADLFADMRDGKVDGKACYRLLRPPHCIRPHLPFRPIPLGPGVPSNPTNPTNPGVGGSSPTGGTGTVEGGGVPGNDLEGLPENASLEQIIMFVMNKMAKEYKDEIKQKAQELSGSTSDDRQTKLTEFQTLVNQRNAMFSLVTNLLQTLHQTDMTTIRNIRA